ncbi:M23 family metallopeptidase [Phascolarctobacterium faecium]
MIKLYKSFILLAILMLLCSTVYAAPITSPFGWRIHPITGEWKFHSGLDIGYEEGTAIPAMMSGTVVYSAWYDGYGYTVILEHTNGDHTLYGHCSALYCNYGQYVEKGTVIAAVGSTGYSTGPHLHLEFWHNNQYTDPSLLWS